MIISIHPMNYFFTSESVSEGHPDKVADQISDAILDAFLKADPNSHVACETLVTTGQVIIAGEVTSEAYIDIQGIVRNTIRNIGYNKSDYQFDADSCGILVALHEQSPDIAMGVNRSSEAEQGAGDQGMMFGYATDETDNYMPLTLDLAHTLMYALAHIRKTTNLMPYLRPDAKAQVTIEYNEHREPVRLDTIVISTQHDPDVTQEQIRKDIIQYLFPEVARRDKRYGKLLAGDFKLLVNPTGQFILGGPAGDTGLTGRKIIVDTYGGRGAHGGGAFSGKDPSKVDRSAAYMARYIAKNMVAAGLCQEALVQLSYAIGVAQPVSVYVNTYGTGKEPDAVLAQRIRKKFDLTPAGIIRELNLKQPIYEPTARYGHMGRPNQIIDGIEYFTWERINKDLF